MMKFEDAAPGPEGDSIILEMLGFTVSEIAGKEVVRDPSGVEMEKDDLGMAPSQDTLGAFCAIANFGPSYFIGKNRSDPIVIGGPPQIKYSVAFNLTGFPQDEFATESDSLGLATLKAFMLVRDLRGQVTEENFFAG